MGSFSAELVATTPLSPRVVGMTFVADVPFPRLAGQYVTLTLDDGTNYAFSVASAFSARVPGEFEIAVTRGTTAARLLDLPLGGTVSVTGPSGTLVWKADSPALLVATGTGISPLRAIVLDQLEQDSRHPLTLLFGCRDASEELWGAELSRLALERPRFRFVVTYSQPPLGHGGRVGRVQTYLAELVGEPDPNLRAYLCGHTPMVNDCTERLLRLGVAAAQIHGESY
jgi:CDP-4-dehydro-6-deoxyglucose reductase